MMQVESYNVEEAYDALNAPMITTRIAFSVRPEEETFRFIRDTGNMEIDGETYHATPYADFSPISSGDGQSADTTTITLDSIRMLSLSEMSVDQVLQTLLNYPLRDRPIQISLAVLNIETREPIGLIPQFVGFIDTVPFTRERSRDTVSTKLEINCASFRAFAQRRLTRTYSDTDHQARFPGDRACRWISDTVFRGGKYIWNGAAAVGAGARNTSSNGGGGVSGALSRVQGFSL